MSSIMNLLELPDLVLFKICTSITCPFDLLHFGSTCTRLRKISFGKRLWWNVAFKWCEGLWVFMREYPNCEDPREWMFEMLKICTFYHSSTELKCIFSNGEVWQRVESQKFRCTLGMLRWAFVKEKDAHPAILYEQWLYDIGLFCRLGPRIDFASEEVEFSENIISELCKLGQSADRDLRRRKQPYKDHASYIKRITNAKETWKEELFPVGSQGSVCPLLICPFKNLITQELTGMQGLSVCVSIALEKRLFNLYEASLAPIRHICDCIRVFTTVFIGEVMRSVPVLEARLGPMSLKTAMLTFVKEDSFNITHLEIVLESFDVTFSPKLVLQDVAVMLNKFGSIDAITDSVRKRLRVAMLDEIDAVLFPKGCDDYTVTRVNLTDSDLIGGNNPKQEMSAAAFISKYAVLVTWHLVGRTRF